MLLSNYGRDQGDSSFEESSQAQPVLHHHQHSHHHHHQPPPPPLTSADSFAKPNLSSPSSSAEQMLACQRPSAAQQQEQQRRLKPQSSDQVLKCPRCDSMNTKFCYYNNYSLTQPRHFCKSCKRYWTKGGALRNVPVGGGCRKNKRVKQRPQDHAHQATSTTTEDTNGAGVTASSAVTSGLDGASSSTILQQEYPAASSSSGLYDVQKASSSLPFERAADHVPRLFSAGPNPPISIHWAGQMALSSQQHQTYDAAASMLGLNMPGSIKQEAGVHSGPELTSMFDSSLAGVAAAAAHAHGVSEGLSSFHHVPMENYGLAGEVLWRFPQPKLVSLLEEGGEPEAAASRHGLLDLEVAAAAAAASRPAAGVDKLKPSKTTIKEVSSSEYEQQQGDSSSQEWQPPAGDGFFEGSGGDTSAYWGNAGGWSSELQYGGGAPASGAQLM